MTSSDLTLLAIPAVVSIAGGVLAALWTPSRQVRSLIQHFAAGVVLAALAVEVFPEITAAHAPPAWLLVPFVAGSVAMYGLKLLSERLETRAEHGSVATGLVIATFIDVAMDGFIIGAGFAAGGTTGLALALGLSVELLFLGLALTSDGPGGARILLLSGGLGATVLAAAIAGAVLLTGASEVTIAAVLSFSAAALLYLVTEELLMEAHAGPEKETPWSTLVIFAGFATFWVIELMI